MATTKLKVTKGADPTPTPQQLQQANQFAKAFALRHSLISGENTNTGGQIPKFVDEKGNDITGKPQGKPNFPLSTFVPPEITELKEDNTGYPYYEHPQTGEVVHVPQDYRYLPRFNPNRGKSAQDLIAKK